MFLAVLFTTAGLLRQQMAGRQSTILYRTQYHSFWEKRNSVIWSSIKEPSRHDIKLSGFTSPNSSCYFEVCVLIWKAAQRERRRWERRGSSTCWFTLWSLQWPELNKAEGRSLVLHWNLPQALGMSAAAFLGALTGGWIGSRTHMG